jgi:hypothetical protein
MKGRTSISKWRIKENAWKSSQNPRIQFFDHLYITYHTELVPLPDSAGSWRWCSTTIHELDRIPAWTPYKHHSYLSDRPEMDWLIIVKQPAECIIESKTDRYDIKCITETWKWSTAVSQLIYDESNLKQEQQLPLQRLASRTPIAPLIFLASSNCGYWSAFPNVPQTKILVLPPVQPRVTSQKSRSFCHKRTARKMKHRVLELNENRSRLVGLFRAPDNEPDHIHLFKHFWKILTITKSSMSMKRRKCLNVSTIPCQDPQSSYLHILHGLQV